jgi:hypothetical protein
MDLDVGNKKITLEELAEWIEGQFRMNKASLPLDGPDALFKMIKYDVSVFHANQKL